MTADAAASGGGNGKTKGKSSAIALGQVTNPEALEAFSGGSGGGVVTSGSGSKTLLGGSDKNKPAGNPGNLTPDEWSDLTGYHRSAFLPAQPAAGSGRKVATSQEADAMLSRAGSGVRSVGKTAFGLGGSALGGVATALGASNPLSLGLGFFGDAIGYLRGDENVIEVGDLLSGTGKPVDQPVSERTAVQTASLADPTSSTISVRPGEASRPTVDVRDLPSVIGSEPGTPIQDAYNEDVASRPGVATGPDGFDGDGGSDTLPVSAAEEGSPSTLPKEDTGVTSPATVSDAVAKAERNKRTRARARRATSFETLMGA